MSTCCRILRMVFMNEASFYRYVSFYLTKYALGIQRCAQYTLKMHFFNRIVTLLRQSISECQFAFFFRLFQNYILCIRCMCSLLLLLSAAFMPFIGKQCKMCEFLSTFVAVIIFYYCKWFYPAKHVKCIVRAIVHTFKYSSTVAKIAQVLPEVWNCANAQANHNESMKCRKLKQRHTRNSLHMHFFFAPSFMMLRRKF